MAKTTIVFEDVGAKSVTIETSVEGEASAKVGASPAAVLALAVRALFDNGLLAEYGAAALEGLEQGVLPSEAIRQHKNKQEGE